jgi:hypothetical protein
LPVVSVRGVTRALLGLSVMSFFEFFVVLCVVGIICWV